MLWLLSIASIAAMAAALTGRTAVDAGRNRVNLERAHWRAMGCARRAQAAIDGALSDAPTSEDVLTAWRTLGVVVAPSELLAGCDVAFEAAGTRIDVNAANDEMIVNLATELGYADQANTMAAALDDWRDADDSVSPVGAEREWYAASGSPLPRNGPLADARELARVRGFEDFARFDSLVTVEPGRISLATAPAAVLQTVPGIGTEAVDAIVARQVAQKPLGALLEIVDDLSVDAANLLTSRYADASRLTTADPDAWIVRTRASVGSPAATEILDWRLARVGRHVVVLESRSE
jgi:type II secretory pathway component PulK